MLTMIHPASLIIMIHLAPLIIMIHPALLIIMIHPAPLIILIHLFIIKNIYIHILFQVSFISVSAIGPDGSITNFIVMVGDAQHFHKPGD